MKWRPANRYTFPTPEASQRRPPFGTFELPSCGMSGRFRMPPVTMAPVPRQLSERERDILDLLLSVDFPGVMELRQQAAFASAEREGMIIDLIVNAEAPRATVVRRTPVEAVVDGDGYDGGLLLFVDDGRLSALEYWWVTEEPPDVMPPLTAVGAPITST